MVSQTCISNNESMKTYNCFVIGQLCRWVFLQSLVPFDACELSLQAALRGFLSESRRGLKKVDGMIGWLGLKTGVRLSLCVLVPLLPVRVALWAVSSITFADKSSARSLLGVLVDGRSDWVSDCTPHATAGQ